MKRYLTQYSVYEVDEDNKLIRRVSGTNDPTPRIGGDGEWKPYEDVLASEIGLVISWPWINPDGSFPFTITSEIVAIEEDQSTQTSSTEPEEMEQ